jgi:Flp pilus assembly protein TadD
MLPILIPLVTMILAGVLIFIFLKDREANLAIVYYNTGVSYLQTGEADKAIAQFQKALEKNKSLLDAHYGLGLAYASKEKYPEAIQELEFVLRQKPMNPVIYYNLGSIYLYAGNYNQALANFEKAVALKPRIKELYFNLGWVLREKGDWVGARENFLKALELDSQYQKAQNYLNLLEALEKEKKKAEIPMVLKHFDKADTEFMIQLDPDRKPEGPRTIAF